MCIISKSMKGIKKENHNYCVPVLQRNYLKRGAAAIPRSEFEKEIKCALTYGVLNAVQTVLDSHKADPYKNVDEMSGALQLILVGSHKLLKKELNLNIPDFTIDHAIEQYGSI